ncbi:protein FAM111B-like isoform X2 [Sinocyclocheilus rhinocerous]|uniref:protein FAM111B-like isoform X2 n=1 Tax=Sinocyclocheilus rhinocerous TaxID=307959 RepID=UPI0007B79C3F|nr:PREDICTED: protein FAM111B-like isoform X2 [Sinocyclocheilus rhinocerous]
MTARHSEPGETSQARNNVQETMAHSLKTEAEERPSNLQQRAEEKEHTFRFRFDTESDPVFVSRNTSMTVLDALGACDTFCVNKNVSDEKKEIVILRADGAAVKTDFPCCLIKKHEILKITFIKKEKITVTAQETQKRLSRTDLVTFYIKTTGKKNMKFIMKNNELRDKTEYVCVYAFKGEEVETALKRDGRFSDTIYQKLCVLTLESREGEKMKKSRYEMSNLVEHLEKKTFQIIATGDKRPDNQKKQTQVKTESIEASAADSAQNYPGQHPNSTEQKTIRERETNFADPSTIGHATQNTYGNATGDSGNSFSTDIQKFLESLCEDVLKKLKQRKNPQIQKFIQEEYDKGVQCFTEVNKVRQIMTLSDSVCLIKVEDSASGTGFLVFDKFILTNAHVVKDCVHSPPEHPRTIKLSKTLTAVFNYEVSGSVAKVLSVKDDVVAYGYETNDRRRFHDFALLELEAAPEDCTELFERYKHVSPPNRGGIYIVGHPDGNIKKMDPCFIIGSENQLQNINKHISENVSCPYVTWQCWPYLHQNRITYNSCLFHGSSGSPVFDEHCCLIGMHSGGFDYNEVEKTRSVIEFAYSMPSIMDAIVTQVKTRSDILKLLYKFKSIHENFDLGPLEDTCGANVPVNEEEQSEEVKAMEVD